RIVPPHAELYGEGNRDRCAYALEDLLNRRKVAQQATSTVAADDALGRAAECALGERFGVRAEDLRGNQVLVVVVGEVALALGLAHAAQAVGGCELGHDETAAGDLVRSFDVDVAGGNCRLSRRVYRSVLDEATEDGVSNPGHWGKDRGGRN